VLATADSHNGARECDDGAKPEQPESYARKARQHCPDGSDEGARGYEPKIERGTHHKLPSVSLRSARSMLSSTL
jgi:hypothetical protein